MRESREVPKNDGYVSVDHRSQLTVGSIGQMWDNFSIKIIIVIDYKPLDKQETLLI